MINQTNNARTRSSVKVHRAIMILAILAMLVSTSSLTLSRDFLIRYQTHAQLQAVADSAAAAGAACLPAQPVRAIRDATLTVERNGVRGSEIIYAAAAPDRMSFKIALRRSAPVILLGLLGRSNVSVTVVATMVAAGAARPGVEGGRLTAISYDAAPLSAAEVRPVRPTLNRIAVFQ